MKTLRIVSTALLFVFMVACSPLTRGVYHNEVVSSAQPPFAARCTLPLKTGGYADPFLFTDGVFLNPATWLNVYGAENVSSPMGIVLLSVAPTNMLWDSPGFAIADGTITSQENFGGQAFSGSVKIVNGATDPFTPFVATAEEASKVNWLAQRYTTLANFNGVKIVLEYREPLPKSLEGSTMVPSYNTDVEAFAARAKAAFSVHFGQPGPVDVSNVRLSGVNQRNLGTFIGSLQPMENIKIDED